MNLRFEVCKRSRRLRIGPAGTPRSYGSNNPLVGFVPGTAAYTGPVTELIHVVGGAVLDSLDAPTRLLVARRTAPERFAGMWEFPGGKVERDEEPRQALHRELKEELGIEVLLGAELPAGRPLGWPLNEKAVMRVWFAEITSGVPQPLEDHDELRWVSLLERDEALTLPWIPADLPIVRALQQYLDAPASRAAGR